MKVCLVNPPLVFHGGFNLIPLGLTYIAAVVREHGYSVSLMDSQIHSRDHIIKVAARADVVGFTSLSNNFIGTAALAHEIKKENPAVIIIIGGHHVTFTDIAVLQQHPYIDVIVRYEGEHTMVETLHALERGDLASVKGITYREKGTIKKNDKRPFIQDLDALPFPARDLLNTKKYYTKGGMPRIVSGRGCPHTCIFCSASSMAGHKVRLRSPGNVVDELEHIVDTYKVKTIGFEDDTFTIIPKHAVNISEEIINRGIDIRWGCNVRVDTLTEELVHIMKKAGCFSFFVGIESGNQKTLNLMNKKITLSQIRDAVALAKKYSIELILTGIIGFPNETYRDVQNTIDFMLSLEGDRYLFNFLMVYPGTELEKRSKELGLNPIDNMWKKVQTAAFQVPVVETEHLTVRDLSRLYVETNMKLDRLFKKKKQSRMCKSGRCSKKIHKRR